MGECPIQHQLLHRAPIPNRLLGYPPLQSTAVMQTQCANRFQANTSPCSSGATASGPPSEGVARQVELLSAVNADPYLPEDIDLKLGLGQHHLPRVLFGKPV
jgi:hypothetical protein